MQGDCFNIVVHPPPSPSGQRPIKGHRAQKEQFHLAQPFARKRASPNLPFFPNRLIPGYSWIRWSRKATSHLNPMTCDGSCHRGLVPSCKSRRGAFGGLRRRDQRGVRRCSKQHRDKTQSSDMDKRARNAPAASEQSNYDIMK